MKHCLVICIALFFCRIYSQTGDEYSIDGKKTFVQIKKLSKIKISESEISGQLSNVYKEKFKKISEPRIVFYNEDILNFDTIPTKVLANKKLDYANRRFTFSLSKKLENIDLNHIYFVLKMEDDYYQKSVIDPNTKDTLKFETISSSKKYGKDINYINDKELKIIHYVHNYKHGLELRIKEGQVTYQAEYRFGVLHGESRKVGYATIEVNNYNKNKRYGTCSVYNKKTYDLIETSFYRMGVIDGTVEKYGADGYLRELSNYTNGELDGVYIRYSKNNGKIQDSLNYVLGIKEGPYKKFDLYGKLSETGTYKNGKKEGPYRIYHYYKVKEEGNYKNGKRNGVIIKYDYRSKTTETYENGKGLNDAVTYDENGNITKSYNPNMVPLDCSKISRIGEDYLLISLRKTKNLDSAFYYVEQLKQELGYRNIAYSKKENYINADGYIEIFAFGFETIPLAKEFIENKTTLGIRKNNILILDKSNYLRYKIVNNFEILRNDNDGYDIILLYEGANFHKYDVEGILDSHNPIMDSFSSIQYNNWSYKNKVRPTFRIKNFCTQKELTLLESKFGTKKSGAILISKYSGRMKFYEITKGYEKSDIENFFDDINNDRP